MSKRAERNTKRYVFAVVSFLFRRLRNFFTFWSLQNKQLELQGTESQLHEAEMHKEKISKEMGTIRQDIDTQKVLWECECLKAVGVCVCAGAHSYNSPGYQGDDLIVIYID